MAIREDHLKEDIFSDSYLDAFYKAHVAARSGRGNLDEDIAAIEAEIHKVQRYRSQFQTYRWDIPLNSCASSECSDDDSDLSPVECSKTSVFKVYNSSCSKINGETAVAKGPSIFSWALRQQILHDHTYCRPSSVPPQIAIDHGTVTIKNIPWHQLSPVKRARAVSRLSSILQHHPSSDEDPLSPSSLEFLPFSLTTSLKRNPCAAGVSLVKGSALLKGRLKGKAAMVTCQRIDIRGIRNKNRDQVLGSGSSRNTLRKKRHSPYIHRRSTGGVEATRVRKNSSGSEEMDIIID
jgi:hypothetical protein